MVIRTRPVTDCLNLSEIKLKPEIIDKLSKFNITTVNQLTKLTLDCLRQLKYFKSSELAEIRLCLVRYGFALNSEITNEKQQVKYDYLIAISNFLRIQSDINKLGKRNDNFWINLGKITIDDLESLSLSNRNKLYYGGYRNLKEILVADYRDIIEKCNSFGKKAFILSVEAIDKCLKEKELIGK